MAVKLRLVRMGKKKQPTYRVVAADSRSPRDGRFLEVVGSYAPRGKSTVDNAAIVIIDHDRAIKWLRDGAQPTDRVGRLLKSAGTLDRMAGIVVDEPVEAAAAPAEAAAAPVEAAPVEPVAAVAEAPVAEPAPVEPVAAASTDEAEASE